MMIWLGSYVVAVPEVDIADNTTVRLDFENEVQPDALLRLEPDLGGRSRIDEDGYVVGPPELIMEVAASSTAYDLHDKRRVYARNGVQEYLVVQVYEQRVDWFSLEEGVYQSLKPDDEGVLRSQVFPGLWLQADDFWAGDLAAMLAVLQQGLASAEHAAFVAQLQAQVSGDR
jgi:Uma2 family endonuclease